MANLTELLNAAVSGEGAGSEQLLPIVYDDLRKLAARKLAQEPPGQTIQATALVHEAYLQLVRSTTDLTWDHRGHFFLAAAEAMRRILIDRARAKKTAKRGGDLHRVELQEGDIVTSLPADELLDLHEALLKLEQHSPKEAKLVTLRYFAGLTLEEAAGTLDISLATASRYWAYASAFLRSTLADSQQD